MLVLSRKLGQQIMIGNDIVVTVLDVRGDRVRLGIVAPTSMPVHRDEVRKRIEAERRTGITPIEGNHPQFHAEYV
ncbi:MAG: carbon storage regulator CsrA [Planctomycetes bacterium]|nr:carbon storage regulator CsrA [Planctomycetota bacterium]